MSKLGYWATLAALGLASLATAPVAQAQSPADFYKGKSLFLVVGSGVGGGYDIYARALAHYWGRHIPGNPAIVIQNMEGAGGITMMNYMANVAKNDGTIVGAGFGNSVIQPVFDQGKFTKYDPRTLVWIGSISPQQTSCLTAKNSPVKTVQDAMVTPAIMTASGNSISAWYANVANTLIGTKFKTVMGYATAETTLAVERGEAEGTCMSSASIMAEHPDWIRDDKLNWLVVISNQPDPLLPGTPAAIQFVKNDGDKQVLDLISSQGTMGRPFVLPPGVPADRTEVLRESFMETLKDPEFLAEAKRLNLSVYPSDHVSMEKMIADTYSIPAPIVAKANSLIEATPAPATKK